MTTKYTSSGIIRNSDKPRVGIVSQHSLSAWFFDDMGSWVDLGYEQLLVEVTEEVRDELGETAEDYDVEEAVEARCQDVETNGPWLLGDWKKNDKGMYVIDETGTVGYAATYRSDSGNVSVEWSRTTKRTHHTSPCYVLADGSGPCGDLDTDGDSVLAYTLPAALFRTKGGT